MKKQRRRKTAKAVEERTLNRPRKEGEGEADECQICGKCGCQPRDCSDPSAPAWRERRLEKRQQAIATVKAKLPYIIYTKKIRKDQRSESPMTPRAEDIHNIPMRMWKREILQWDKLLKQNCHRLGWSTPSVVVKNTFLEVNDGPEDPKAVAGRGSTRYYRRAATDSVLKLADSASEEEKSLAEAVDGV